LKIQFYILFTISIYLAFANLGDSIESAALNDKLLHMLGFIFLAISAYLSQNFTNKRNIFIFLVTYSFIIEIIQFTLPYRNYSNLDLIANLIGIIFGLILVKIMNFLVKNY
tara:strand:- start:92 stop:424 length:333 start_codon:yes stop_codon:yes gene_type:complete